MTEVPTPAQNKTLVTLIVMSATIMQVLDTTIINVAIPEMQGALNAAPDEITWVLTSYLVSSAIFLPLTGFIADRIGRREYLLISMIGFTIASMLCGISESLTQLVIFRTLQGVFGAGLVPLSQAILADTYPPEERGMAMSIWGMGVMLGPILGPTLGGYFTEYMNWRWNFYVNVPVGVITIIGVWYCIADTPKVVRKLDWIGFGLLALGIGMLQFTLDRGNQDDWFNSNLICITTGIAIFGIFGFLIYSKYSKREPMFNVAVITNRNFYTASIIMSFLALGFYGAMVLQPIMLSNLFDYPEFTIGLVMAPRGLASMFCMLFVGRLMNILHPRYILLLGLALNMLGNYAATYYTLDSDMFTLIFPILLQGCGIGLSFIPLSTMCLSTMPKQFMNEAAGLFSLMRTIGASAGISIVITYFTRQSQVSWNELGGFINPYNPSVYQYLSSLNLEPTDPLAAQILQIQLSTYTQLQAIIDSFFLLSFCFILMVPLTMLFRVKQTETVVVIEN